MSIDLKEKKRRKFLHLLTYFLTSDTIQFFDETKCKGCQTCVQKCPTSAINKDTYQIKEELCVGCLRCEKVCPGGARSSDYEAVKKYLEDNFCLPKEIKCY